jgi:hypothetical protein
LLLCSNSAALSIFHGEIRDGIDLRIKIQPSPYLNKQPFFEYVHEVFLPAVESNREFTGCRGNPAILFCDNYSCHCSDEILRELASRGVLLMAYPPHSSHIFQVLNLLLFVKLKSKNTFLETYSVTTHRSCAACLSSRRTGNYEHHCSGFLAKDGIRIHPEG